MDAGGDDRVELDKLIDPASECEKSSWTDYFEEIYFYYKTYEKDSVSFSRTSTE